MNLRCIFCVYLDNAFVSFSWRSYLTKTDLSLSIWYSFPLHLGCFHTSSLKHLCKSNIKQKKKVQQNSLFMLKKLPDSNQDRSYRMNMLAEYHVTDSHLHYLPHHRRRAICQSLPLKQIKTRQVKKSVLICLNSIWKFGKTVLV